VIARLARRAPECRRALRILAPAGRPLDRGELATVATTFESLVDGIPPRSTTRPRRGDGVLDADLRAGVIEALDHGFLVERPDHRLEVRHELVAQAIEGRPAARSSAAAITSHWPPRSPRIRRRR
jgi:hypothetical protein